ncbi:TOMM precursor leader peptide-binding protein [Nonomuraea sp. NPDC004297]
MSRPGVVVLGAGWLAEVVAGELDGEFRLAVVPGGPVPGDLPGGDVVVAVHVADGRPGERPAAGVPLLPVSGEPDRVVIGPLTRPGVPGCGACADSRRARNHPGWAAVVARHRQALRGRPPSLTPAVADVVAAIVGDEVRGLVAGTPVRTEGALLLCRPPDLSITTHRLLPDPLCPHCGVAPADSAGAARIVPVPRPKPRPGTLRLREVAAEHDALVAAFVDPEVGLIGELETGDEGGLPVARAHLAIRGTDATESGWGRDLSYRGSVVTAILEAVERWGGLQAGGRRPAVRAAWRDVRDTAIDPRSFGLHDESRYGRPGFPFVPFHDDLELSWIWAHSFGRGEPVLVPETYAYYGAHLLSPDEPRLAYEISNGCALGGSLEEAILHGLLEVAERDAFLMTWYARRPVAAIDLGTARDPRLRMLAAHLEERTGRTITVLDTTVEHGVPTVWAIAVDRDGGERARAVCAGGAHLDPERAAGNALRELGPILASVERAYRQHRARVSAMAADPALVTTMGDHSLLYADPAVFSRLEFLFAAQRRRSLDELGVPVSPDDLTEDLERAVGRFLAAGLDVVVVDQSTPEQSGAGLSCVKVIVPGALPMTFGHGMRRVTGLPRLFRVPRLLGDPAPPVTPADLNPHPHPFP